MAASNVLIRVDVRGTHVSESQSDDSEIIAPLTRRQDTGLSGILIRRGPGLTMYQLVCRGGEFIEWIANITFPGPKIPKSQIDKFFSCGDARQTALDNLYTDREQLGKKNKKLRGHCRKLLKYALPG